MTEVSIDHRKFEELLPWYLTDRLDADERDTFEAHLKGCLPCNAALREERRLRGLMQGQEVLPVGPEHGVRGLLRRIDGHEQASLSARLVRPRTLGYGLAACLGGVVVWLILAIPGASPPGDAAFSTLATVSEDSADRFDIVFTQPPTASGLASFVDETGARLVTGPSEIGRYTFTLDGDAAANMDAFLEQLRRDPRVAFAGRSFVPAEGVSGEGP